MKLKINVFSRDTTVFKTTKHTYARTRHITSEHFEVNQLIF